MAFKAFLKEYLVDELGLPHDNDGIVISDKITGSERWSTVHELIFRDPATDKVYRTNYSEGATEEQDESPWQFEKAVTCQEMELRPVVEMRYVSVGKQQSKENLLRSVVAAKRCQEELEASPVLAAAFGEGYVRELLEGMSADEVCAAVDSLLAGEDVNQPSASCQEDKSQSAVPDKFVEKLIEKVNALYREAGEPFQVIVREGESGREAVVVDPTSDSEAESRNTVPLDVMFSFYREYKQDGEKKPMRKTAEKLRAVAKEQAEQIEYWDREGYKLY